MYTNTVMSTWTEMCTQKHTHTHARWNFFCCCFLNFFNGRIIALQNFVVFCRTSTRISHRYTHVPSLLDLLPSPTLQPVSEALFEFPESYSKFPLAICFTYGTVNSCYSLHLHRSPFLPPLLLPCP